MRFYKIILTTLLVSLFIFVGIGSLHAESQGYPREYKLKAAFMLNFAKFTTWPEKAFNKADQFFHFCIVGEDPFAGALRGLELKKVGGRPVKVHYAKSILQAEDCHVLFISKSEKADLARIHRFIEGRAVISVSDIKGFGRSGGIFEFINRGGRLSFIVNNKQLIENGLQVNASLLNLAAEVL